MSTSQPDPAGREEIVLRAALPADIPGMCDLLEELFRLETDFSPDRRKQTRGLELLLTGRAGASFVAVAVQGCVVIGMATVQLIVSTAEGGPAGLVEDVIVRREFRGRGVAGRLFSHVETWCRANGATRLQLLADRDNAPARNFYAHNGWAGTNLICLRRPLPGE